LTEGHGNTPKQAYYYYYLWHTANIINDMFICLKYVFFNLLLM
jgi:hypothetical protein